jgi:hypothetical protein
MGEIEIVYVPTKRLILLPFSKRCYQFNIIDKALSDLPYIKHKRYLFNVSYSYGDRYMYIIGGKDNQSFVH